MPKEKIDGIGYDMVVGWAPDQEMQVAVQTVGEYSVLSQLYGDQESLAKLGSALHSAVRAMKYDSGNVQPERIDAETRLGLALQAKGDDWASADREVGRALLDLIESTQPNHTGLWATLTRQQVNRLIRMLRRARDSVYGKDE